jgi:hypothetical protein
MSRAPRIKLGKQTTATILHFDATRARPGLLEQLRRAVATIQTSDDLGAWKDHPELSPQFLLSVIPQVEAGQEDFECLADSAIKLSLLALLAIQAAVWDFPGGHQYFTRLQVAATHALTHKEIYRNKDLLVAIHAHVA